MIAAFRCDGTQASFAHLKPQLMEVAIHHIERELRDALVALAGPDVIRYSTTVHRIDSVDAVVNVVLCDHHSDKITVQPALVLVCDGANSPMRRALGIDQVVLSQTTLFAISSFERRPSAHHDAVALWLDAPTEGVKRVASFYAALGRGLVRALADRPVGSVTDAMVQAAGGPAAIFRTPDDEYVFHDVLPVQRAAINHLRQTIRRLGAERDTLNALGASAEEVARELAACEDDLRRRLADMAYRAHGIADVGSRLVRRQHHRMATAVTHRKTTPVDSTLTRAAHVVVGLGDTVFVLGGDAAHTTDATSGFGAKTAMEEVVALAPLLRRGVDEGQVSALQLAACVACHDTFSARMVDAGFRERDLYEPGTDTLDRHADRLLTAQQVTPAEVAVFRQLELLVAVDGFHMTGAMTAFVRAMFGRLRGLLVQPPPADVVPNALSRKQRKLWHKAVEHALCWDLDARPARARDFWDATEPEMRRLCSRLALCGGLSGSVMFVWLFCRRLLAPAPPSTCH